MLPLGTLREPKRGILRADMVVVTKCPRDLKPMEFRVITKAMNLFPYQQLFFTTLVYDDLRPVFCGEERSLDSITPSTHVLLLTGIASPKQMIVDLEPHTKNILSLPFADHHTFKRSDIDLINTTFATMPHPKLIVTTEKDCTRLLETEGLSDDVRHNLYALPLRIKFMEKQEKFDEHIIGYVRKNSRNSILTKVKDERQRHGNQKSHTIKFH